MLGRLRKYGLWRALEHSRSQDIATEGTISITKAANPALQLDLIYNRERIDIWTLMTTLYNKARIDTWRPKEPEPKLICTIQPDPLTSFILEGRAWIRNPRTRLEITVHSFLRPRALEIAFEILACANSYFKMGHVNLASLLNSQSVSR